MVVHKRSSLKDIAEALGLSKTTVSFVLNGKANEYHIGEETAKRVWEMAERLQYNPNFTAISLRDGCSKILGIVVSDISNPFFASLADFTKTKPLKLATPYSLAVPTRMQTRCNKLSETLLPAVWMD